jgi:hypothetical protein
MIQENTRPISASRVVASSLGVLVGIYGMEHGFFELLQGSVRPTEAPLGLDINALGFGFIIDAIGPAHEFWPGASEPAFTIIPNFLITGILAIIFGLLVLIWSLKFIESKYGARIFFFLCIVLFLVGGGSPPLSIGIIAVLVATRINKPLTWWQNHLSEDKRDILARFWPWSLILAVLVSLIGVEAAIFGIPFIWFFDLEQMTLFLLIIGNLSLLLTLMMVPTAFAYDIENLGVKEKA